MNVFKKLLTSISDWQNSALFVFRFMLVPLNDQPTRRETRKRERHRRKKNPLPFFHMGELLIDFTACPSICSIFQSEPISNCHDDHRPKSTVEPSLSVKGRDTYILKVGLKKIALTASDRSSPIALVFFYFGARNPKFLAAQKYLVCNI